MCREDNVALLINCRSGLTPKIAYRYCLHILYKVSYLTEDASYSEEKFQEAAAAIKHLGI